MSTTSPMFPALLPISSKKRSPAAAFPPNSPPASPPPPQHQQLHIHHHQPHPHHHLHHQQQLQQQQLHHHQQQQQQTIYHPSFYNYQQPPPPQAFSTYPHCPPHLYPPRQQQQQPPQPPPQPPSPPHHQQQQQQQQQQQASSKRERDDAHASKRARVAAARAERPRYVLAAAAGAGDEVERVGAIVVDVRRPGRDGVVESGVGLRGVLGLAGGGGGEMKEAGGRIVLCFLGGTVEHLCLLSQITTHLSTLQARVFGVSLTLPPANCSTLPIVHDATRQLTLHLGLLHPLGGGRHALDAIVVLDGRARRRLVLPIVTANPHAAGGGAEKGLSSLPFHDSSPATRHGMCSSGIRRDVLRNGTTDDEEGDTSVAAAVRNCVKGLEWLAAEEEEEMRRGDEDGMDVEMGGD